MLRQRQTTADELITTGVKFPRKGMFTSLVSTGTAGRRVMQAPGLAPWKALFWALTFIGSVYLGYHYAIDAPVAAMTPRTLLSTLSSGRSTKILV